MRLPPGNCVWGGAAGGQRICARPSAEVHHPLTPFAPAATAQEHDRSIGSLSPGALPPCWVSLADKFMTDTPTVADRCSMVFPAGGASRLRGAGPAGCPRAPPPRLPPSACSGPAMCPHAEFRQRGHGAQAAFVPPPGLVPAPGTGRKGGPIPVCQAGAAGDSPVAGGQCGQRSVPVLLVSKSHRKGRHCGGLGTFSRLRVSVGQACGKAPRAWKCMDPKPSRLGGREGQCEDCGQSASAHTGQMG